MAAAAKNITKVCLELGGKAPAIVMDDADLELAVKAVVDSRVINTGQVCNCVERVYVQQGIYDRFVNRLGEAMKAVQFGDPATRDDIAMGPLINAAARDRWRAKWRRRWRRGRGWRWAVSRWRAKAIFIRRPCCWMYVRRWTLSMRKPSVRCCRWWPFDPR